MPTAEHIYNMIQAVPAAATAYAANDDAGVVAAMNAKTIEHKDSTPQTSRAIVVKFGLEQSALALGTFEAAGASNRAMYAMYLALNAGGLDFSDPILQAVIDQLASAGSWPDSLRDGLKEMGICYVLPAKQHLGIDSISTGDVVKARVYQTIFLRARRGLAALDIGINAGTISNWTSALALIDGTL